VEKMRQEVEGLDPNRLLNTAPDDLKRYFVEKHSIDPIRLLRDDWYADTHEVQVDVRYDPMRWIDDKSRPALVPGERIEVRVPFEGESELFYCCPNTFTTSPRARLSTIMNSCSATNRRPTLHETPARWSTRH
jgi:hypothetical protein